MTATLAEQALSEVQAVLGKGLTVVTVKEVVLGVNYTAVLLSTDDIGLANTPLDEFSSECCGLFSSAGGLADLPVIEMA